MSFDGSRKVKHIPNQRFANYQNVFQNLIKTTSVPTDDSIVNCVISFDSTKAITVTKRDENEYYILLTDLESFETEFEMKVGGNPGQYIKVKEVEQN